MKIKHILSTSVVSVTAHIHCIKKIFEIFTRIRSPHFYPWAFQAEGVLSLPASVRKLNLVFTITQSQIWAGITKFAPNMHHGDTLGWYRKWRSLTLTFKVILAILIQNSRKFGLSRTFEWIWARITKFAPNMHLWIISAGIENGRHWPWPSRSFGHFD